jgi:hypothetical protein
MRSDHGLCFLFIVGIGGSGMKHLIIALILLTYAYAVLDQYTAKPQFQLALEGSRP